MGDEQGAPDKPEGERHHEEQRRWEAAALYDPLSPEAAERLALLEYLSSHGATVEQMVQADRIGALPGLASDLVIQGWSPHSTVAEMAARRGIPVSHLERVLVAAGIPAESHTEIPDRLSGLLDAFARGASVLGEEPVLAFTRVLGSAAMHVAEAAIALFLTERGPGTGREGPDELTQALLAETATSAFTSVPDVLATMVMDAFVRAERRAEMARGFPLSDAPADRRVEWSGPSENVALGFVDLVGSTAWAQTLELRDQSLALTRFESAAWSSAVLAGGRVIKTIGDEVFFAAPTADAACRIGTEVCQAAADDPELPRARGAVGIGTAIPREGDYFGPLVNLLSRLVKSAAPGELVASEEVAASLSPDVWSLRQREPVDLRGIDGPIQTFHVEPADRSTWS